MNSRIHSLRRQLKRFERSLDIAAKTIKERNISLAKLRRENDRLRQQLEKVQSNVDSESLLINAMDRHINTLEDRDKERIIRIKELEATNREYLKTIKELQEQLSETIPTKEETSS